MPTCSSPKTLHNIAAIASSIGVRGGRELTVYPQIDNITQKCNLVSVINQIKKRHTASISQKRDLLGFWWYRLLRNPRYSQAQSPDSAHSSAVFIALNSEETCISALSLRLSWSEIIGKLSISLMRLALGSVLRRSA